MVLADRAGNSKSEILAAMRSCVSDIVDFHNHLGCASDAAQSAKQLLADCDAHRVDTCVVLPINEECSDPQYTRSHESIADLCGLSNGRLVGFLRVKAGRPASARRELARFDEYGFCGIKLHPLSDSFTAGQAEFVVEFAADRGVPVLVHCAHNRNCTPRDWEAIAARHENAVIVLAHSGRTLVEEAIEAAKRRHNIMLDTSINILFNLKMAARCLPVEKFLFASDTPYSDRILDYFKMLLVWDAVELPKVMATNARKLLNGRR